MWKIAIPVLVVALLGAAGYFFYQGMVTRQDLELAATASAPPALHVIGIHEAADQSRKKDAERDACMAKAIGNPAKLAEEPPDFGPVIACASVAMQHAEGTVEVEITDKSGPLVLALTAYEPTLWKISKKRGVRIQKLILAGYHAQRAEGLDDDTPIEIFSHESSAPCDQCVQHSDYFHSYEQAPAELYGLTGLDPVSFQGSYKGDEFLISANTRTAARQARQQPAY